MHLLRPLPRRPLNLAAWVVALVAAALLASCGGGGFFFNSQDAQIRLVNATSEFSSGGLDLYESDNLITSGTTPYAASDYTGLKAGDYTFNLKVNGSGTTSASLGGSATRGDHTTIVAYVDGGALAAKQLSDEEGDPGSGRAKLRIFHAAPTDTGNVDVYLIDGACSTLGSSIAAAFATNVSGLQDSYTEVSAASGGTTYHLCVTATGSRTDVRLDVPALTLVDQQITTLILVHTQGGFLLNGLRLDQQGALTQLLNSSARLRVAASASGGAAVSVTVNNVAVAASLTSPAVGAYQAVSAGTLSVDLTVGGSSVAVSGLPSLAAGADATLLITGTGTATLILDDNAASTSTSQPVKLRLVNGLNGGSGAMTMTLDNSIIASNIAFTAASTPALVAASSSSGSTLAASNSTGQLVSLTGSTLTSGNSYTLFVLGDAGSPNGLLLSGRQ